MDKNDSAVKLNNSTRNGNQANSKPAADPTAKNLRTSNPGSGIFTKQPGTSNKDLNGKG